MSYRLGLQHPAHPAHPTRVGANNTGPAVTVAVMGLMSLMVALPIITSVRGQRK